MDNMDLLSPVNKVLVSLLNTKFCTTRQVAMLLNYTSISTASELLRRMLSRKYLKRMMQNKSVGGYIYYLAPKGYATACSLTGIPVDTNDKYIMPSFITKGKQGSNNIYIAHSLRINDIYYMIAKEMGIGNFKWNYGKESRFTANDITDVDIGDIADDDNIDIYSEVETEKNKKIEVRSDAYFVVNKESFLLEVDLCSEFRKKLEAKFYNIAAVIKGNVDLEETPAVLFSIETNFNPGHTLDRQADEEISKARGIINEINRKLRISALEELSEENIEQFDKLGIKHMQKLKESLEFILNSETKYLYSRVVVNSLESQYRKINSYLHYSESEDDENEDAQIRELVKEKNRLLREIENIKKDYIDSVNEKKFISRSETIKSILVSEKFEIGDKGEKKVDNIMLPLLQDCLDFYIVDYNGTKRLIEDTSRFELSAREIIAEYCISLFMMKTGNNNSYEIEKHNRFKLMYPNGEVVSSKIAVTLKNKQVNRMQYEEVCMIEDMSRGNFGGYLRARQLVRQIRLNGHPSHKEVRAIIIVDSIEQAEALKNERENWEFPNPDILFITVDDVYKKYSIYIKR